MMRATPLIPSNVTVPIEMLLQPGFIALGGGALINLATRQFRKSLEKCPLRREIQSDLGPLYNGVTF